MTSRGAKKGYTAPGHTSSVAVNPWSATLQRCFATLDGYTVPVILSMRQTEPSCGAIKWRRFQRSRCNVAVYR
jgi:hypothetical protein